MIKSGTVLSLVSLLALFSPLASAAHYKLFVLTGQSNSLGTTNAGEADPSSGSDPADSHIRFFWHNRVDGSTAPATWDSDGVFSTLQDQAGGVYAGSATHWGPEVNFGRTLYRAGVRNFGIIKASRGGGGNSFWLKTATDHHMYDHVVNTVTAATNILTANGDTFEIAGLLYLQGESDNSTEASEAGSRFKTLVDHLRVDLPGATNLHGIIGGIAAAGATRDTVRANQAAIGASTAYIDYFSNLDLQGSTAPDALHFNKTAKLRIGERFAQAFFSANIVSRHYGRLVFVGDSITQGGNGDHPSYRYQVFKHLAGKGVPVNATTGYKFTGSVTGALYNNVLTAPGVNGQTFENVHDGHYGWRASWINGRVRLPRDRRNANRGEGTLLNWTGQANPAFAATAQQYAVSNADGLVTYPDPGATDTGSTGVTHVPDTVSIMIGINDLGDNNNSANQVVADIGTMINQLRAVNPTVRIHVTRLLYTNQTQAMKDAVDAVNSQLQTLANAKNAASATSPVWIIDASTGFNPVTMTYDAVHPNTAGEAYVGDRIAAALGIIETPADPVPQSSEPPHLESGSSSFNSKFEGNQIWNGTNYLNSWSEDAALNKTLVADGQSALTDLRLVHPGTNGHTLNGANSGWAGGRAGDWTFETRLKFSANANGFILWLGTGTQRILVEIYSDRTQDYANNTFNVAHNNLDGNFHSFRIAHESVAGKYHVWRDGVRLTPVAGVAYDAAAADGRLLMGDYTSGTFGNNFDATLDYVRFDSTAAYLPTGADSDTDGLPDSWEYAHFQADSTYPQRVSAITAGAAGGDDDGDGKTNLEEYISNTDPQDANSRLTISSSRFVQGGAFEILLPLTSPQRNYTLYKSADLGMTDPWSAIDGPAFGTDGNLLLQDLSPEILGFYKVGVTVP